MKHPYKIDTFHYKVGRENIDFVGPTHLLLVLKALIMKMLRLGPLCCMSGEIDDTGTVRVSRCSEHTPTETTFRFSWEVGEEGAVAFTLLPPQTFREELEQKVARLVSYESSMRGNVIDEEGGVAVFILFELLENPRVVGPRGHQERYSLWRLRRGGEPELLTSDHAWTGTPGFPGLSCVISHLVVAGGKVTVDHFTTPTFTDCPQQKETLTFDL